MNRKADIYMFDKFAGSLKETESGYEFIYTDDYFSDKNNLPISLTFPLTEKFYFSRYMFSFFDGLIPEGWLLHIAENNWKLNPHDRMGLLMACCKDCIGAVSVILSEEL